MRYQTILNHFAKYPVSLGAVFALFVCGGLVLAPWVYAGDEEFDLFYGIDGKVRKGKLEREVLDYFVVKDPNGKTQRIVKSQLQKVVSSDGEVIYEKGKTSAATRSDRQEPSTKKQRGKGTGFLDIATKPMGATVAVDDIERAETPVRRLEVDAGKRRVTVTLQGHKTQEQNIVVEEGETTKLRFSLEARSRLGRLTILTKPQGATIIIDGEEKGTAPLRDVELEPGEYKVFADLKGYTRQEIIVTIKEKREKKIRFKLKREKDSEDRKVSGIVGYLQVDSKPVGARVFVDGVDRGATPAKKIELDVGEHKVEITLKEYSTQTRTVVVKKRKTQKIKVELGRAPVTATKKITKAKPDTAAGVTNGYLAVTSSPKGARVKIDGVDQGITPLNRIVSAGSHAVVISMRNFKSQERIVAVKKGQTGKVYVELVPGADAPPVTASAALKPTPKAEPTGKPIVKMKNGYLHVASKPTEAIVAVDGVEKGVTPYSQIVQAGVHAVHVSLEGYHSQEQQVAVKRGKTSKVYFRLSRSGKVPAGKAEIKAKPVKKGSGPKVFIRLTTGAMALAGLGTATYFYVDTENKYQDYQNKVDPAELGLLHKDIRRSETNRNIAGIVGLVGILGLGVSFAF